MIRSMTGYGRAQLTLHDRVITVELKSVNNKYFDCSVRCPRAYGFLEESVRQGLRGCISRGKLDVGVLVETFGEAEAGIIFNKAIAEKYLSLASEVGIGFDIKNDLTVSKLFALPEVINVRHSDEDTEQLTGDVAQVTAEAVSEFDRMRVREGERLKADVLGRIPVILAAVEEIEKRSPQCTVEYRQKLRTRIEEYIAGLKVDEGRLLTEVAIFADRTAVDEETVRLRSHLSQLSDLLNKNDAPIGKKLDFIMQELNREANTTGSKSSDLTLTDHVIVIKAELEKIREQIQNIE